jgi:hypothetical protein
MEVTMPKTATAFLTTALLAATAGAWAQGQAQPASPQQPQAAETGFFRPSSDIRLAPLAPRPATPAAPQAPVDASPALSSDAAEQVRLAEEARLQRMEASMDRIEARNQRAMEEANRQLPAITSPTDGTARIMSPLDGTAPLVSGLGR